MSECIGAGRYHPEWARPLAPLPEWLESIEQLLKTSTRPADRYGSLPVIVTGLNDGLPVEPWYRHIRCHRMQYWRAWRGIPRCEAARILGYEYSGVIERIERGFRDSSVSRNLRRQQSLAEFRWGEPISDRCHWLKAWRKRLGIYQWQASNILGYSGRRSIARIENRWAVPAWERILMAIDAENALKEGFPLPE